ncbi:helix-turn-helix domain-containing protein [Halocatena halophila]|uniref:helix-turn-helix domain-containing protein n=1 Tax=Halocatena halophila TaxID=2814576 RepID=UPI002ED192B2
MKYLRLNLRYAPAAQHPMHRFMSESDAIDRELLVAWNLTAETDITYALFYVVGDRESYETALEAVDTNESYDLTPVHDGTFYAYLRERDTDRFRRFRAAFEQPSLMAVPPLDYRSNGMLTFDVVGEPASLEAVLDQLPKGISAEIREVGEYDARPGIFTTTLTARQREALAAASNVGYYEVPREGSVADVAEALGCAPSTASNHLRKAEARLVEHTVG